MESLRARGARTRASVIVVQGVTTMSEKKTSQQKIEANRRDARKSTGPRSPAGKARSSRNAVKHGLLTARVVLLDHPDEDPREFDGLLDGLMEDFKPHSTIEQMLVERLAASFWRLRRAYRFETESIAQANRPNAMSQMLQEFSPLPASEPTERVLPSAPDLDKLVRYESMIDRELLRTMAQLDRLQRRRMVDEPGAKSQAALPALAGRGEAPQPPAPNEPTAGPTASAARRSEKGRKPVERHWTGAGSRKLQLARTPAQGVKPAPPARVETRGSQSGAGQRRLLQACRSRGAASGDVLGGGASAPKRATHTLGARALSTRGEQVGCRSARSPWNRASM